MSIYRYLESPLAENTWYEWYWLISHISESVKKSENDAKEKMKLFQTKTDNIPKDCKPKKICHDMSRYVVYVMKRLVKNPRYILRVIVKKLWLLMIDEIIQEFLFRFWIDTK